MDYLQKKMLDLGRIAVVFVISMALFWGCAATQATRKDPSAPAEKSAEAVKTINGIQASETGLVTEIRVLGSDVLTYTSVKQPSPLGVILYFPDTAFVSDNTQVGSIQDGDIVGSVELSAISENASTTRLAILLKKDTPYEVSRDGTDLVITFTMAAGSETPSPASTETAEAKTAASATSTAATRLIQVASQTGPNGVSIDILADGTIENYKSFTISNPARIVFDLFNISSPIEKEQRVAVDTPWVKQVRHYGYPDRVRVVLDTEDSYLSAFSAVPSANGLVIQVGDASSKNTGDTSAAGAPTGPTPKTVVASAEAAWINRIDFASEETGKSTVIVGTTLPVNYDIQKTAENRLKLELYKTKLPDYRRRPLITTRFTSAVDRITPMQPASMPDTAVIIVEMREAVPYFVEQTDNLLMVHFEPSAVPPQPLDTAKLPDWQQVIEEGVPTAETPMVSASEMPAEEKIAVDETDQPGMEISDGGTGPAADAPRMLPGAQKQYTGEKIALDFYETDIKNVFRILREISGKNFAVDKDVTGQVTLSLDRPVPWDQVLDLILKMNGLGMTMEGDIIRIATNQTLANEREIAQARMTAAQETAEQARALEPLVTEYIPVNYANAQGDVLPQIATTPERGQVTVDARNNQIIITDTAEMVRRARETVQRIDKVTPQVLIEARIVEANKTFTRAIGTQWNSTAGPIFTKEFAGGLLPEGALDLTMAATNPVAGLGSIGLNFTKLTGTPFSLLNAQLSASESQGLIKIISAPRILTLDNKQAIIKQGLAYPLTKIDADGNTTVEFQDVALELQVTPHVTPDNRISLAIRITNNEIGAVINNQTSFTTKEANTELLVNDGDTLVIGGIRKSTKRDNESGLPVLKNMPLLGWMFKQQDKTDNLEELLIFITPKIVLLEQRS